MPYSLDSGLPPGGRVDRTNKVPSGGVLDQYWRVQKNSNPAKVSVALKPKSESRAQIDGVYTKSQKQFGHDFALEVRFPLLLDCRLLLKTTGCTREGGPNSTGRLCCTRKSAAHRDKVESGTSQSKSGTSVD